MSAPVDSEHTERINRALEGLLSPAEFTAFQGDITRDPVLRAAYVDRAWLHGALHAERDRLLELLEPTDVVPRSPLRWHWFAGLGLAAAAAVAIAFIGGRRAAPENTVATLVQSDNTKWAGSTLPTFPQSRLRPGMLSLLEGIATVRFESGAVVTLEAPTKLEILSAMRCRLIEGSITADVPPTAHGFAVETPDLQVVDLGTRFGVTASSTGNSHVFVFKGEVRLDDFTRSVVRRLTAGRAYLSGSGPSVTSTEPNRAEPAPPIDGWTSITTAMGRGRDGYARRGDWPAAGAQPLLLVKHTDLDASRPNERRAIITFDLEKLAAADIADAQLVLDPEPSGFRIAPCATNSSGLRSGRCDGFKDCRHTPKNSGR